MAKKSTKKSDVLDEMNEDPTLEAGGVDETPEHEDAEAVLYVDMKKKAMKESQYRKKFDNLCEEIEVNIVNTAVSYGEKIYERSGWGSVMTYTKTANGNTDMNMYPQKLNGRDQNRSGVPVSQEPIAFSKILIATSVLAGRLPDATVTSDSKVFSKTMYELWKRTWSNPLSNGDNTMASVYQNVFTYGWAAWRVYPRRVQVKRNGVDKIIFDDIYREPLNPKRTWLGVGFNNYDKFSQFEIYYEKDMPKEDFEAMYPAAKGNEDKLDYCSVSEEAKNENIDKMKTHVTIGYYENMLLNRYIVKCGKMLIYDGEMPNNDSFGSIMVARCFSRGMDDPYAVGLYELMRGNTAIYSYINSMNAQQVEAEIYPLLFGPQVQNGTSTYKRGPNIVNPKTPGTQIDVVNTKGNIQGGIAYANQQKQDIEDNTGVNNIVAGQSSSDTLGATVILKEAALNRLVIPRNNIVAALELDALITTSWIKQTYSAEKVFMVTDDQSVQEFAKQNPDYFMQAQPIVDDNDTFKGFAIVASPNLRLKFDFDEEGEVMENVPERKISASGLFSELDSYGHSSNYINFVIDPNSMLLPSQEIQKQQYSVNFPVITNQISQIFALRAQDPQASQSQLMALEAFLKANKEDIYDYMTKTVYDEIMQLKPSATQIAMQQMQQQLAPQDGETPGQGMTPDGTDPMQPQNPNEMASPQGALGSSMDASMGYAASMPMTPNK